MIDVARGEQLARGARKREGPMDDHVKQLLLLGREHYEKREFDKAEYLLKQVVAETDRFADVFERLPGDSVA